MSTPVYLDNYYDYDGLQQVTGHQVGQLTGGPPYTGIDPATLTQQEAFAFDETGNWTSTSNTVPGLSQTRVNNTANQTTGITGPSGVVQPAYDAAGNMTTLPQPADWTRGYDVIWDAWNRPVQISDSSGTVASYAYDARTRRTTATNASGDLRDYYYNYQWRSIEEHLTVSGTHTLDHQNVWNPADRWTLIRSQNHASGSVDLYCLKDYLDPAAIIDDSAAVLQRCSYDAFGQVSYQDWAFTPLTSPAIDWNFLFHGEFQDLDTGLYNYGYRYYHPQLGRWISRDPIGEAGGANLFKFGNNNPIFSKDILGEETSLEGMPAYGLQMIENGYPAQQIADETGLKIAWVLAAIAEHAKESATRPRPIPIPRPKTEPKPEPKPDP